MKTGKTTRVSSSDNVVDVRMPVSWQELTQQELKTVYSLMSVTDTASLPTLVFFALSQGRVMCHAGSKFLLRFGKRLVEVSDMSMSELLVPLDFLATPGNVPVRLETMRSVHAVEARLHGVPFGEYLKLENLYQGYISSKNPKALSMMASILYPGFPQEELSDAETINILNWAVQIKNMFSSLFCYFFRPATASTDRTKMADVMNAQIRALTQGDITKEEQVLAMDCWRALTELDALARESEEIKQKKHKQ